MMPLALNRHNNRQFSNSAANLFVSNAAKSRVQSLPDHFALTAAAYRSHINVALRRGGSCRFGVDPAAGPSDMEVEGTNLISCCSVL